VAQLDAGRLAREAVRGAGRGVAGTVAMSIPMLVAGRPVMGTQPPKRVTIGLLRRVGVRERNERQRKVASTLAHLGFGAGAGTLFTVGRATLSLPGPALPQGLAYGIAVWATSYKGWVPALGLLPPPERDRTGRQVVLFVGHVIFGAVLGLEGRRRTGRCGRR
jgi:hypothetical protein